MERNCADMAKVKINNYAMVFFENTEAAYKYCRSSQRPQVKNEVLRLLDRLKVLVERMDTAPQTPTDPPPKPKRKKAAQPPA